MVDKKIVKEQTKNLLKRLNDHNLATYGDYVKIGDFTYGNPTIKNWGEKTTVSIGKFCSFSDGVIILAGGEHRMDWVSTYPFNTSLPAFGDIKGHPQAKGETIIGNDVWVGTNAIILSGVKIGDGAVIGAGAIVTKGVEPYAVVAGNPARLIRYRFEKEVIQSLSKIKWWDWDIEKVLDNVESLQNGDIEGFIKTHLNNN